MIGRLIQNRYEIQKSIGQDSLSLIYKGWDKKLDKNVAIKVFKEPLTENSDFFLDRVQFLFSLNHKNIVRFYDAGVEHGFYYLIMEYVDGFSLKEFMEKYQLKDSVIYSVQLCFQVCQGLDYAHKNYFFHGDLRPDNIMIANNGTIKLNNFGLTRLELEMGLNSSREIINISSYRSPEQIKGEEIDFRSDIYSLGIINYELLRGKSILVDEYSCLFSNIDKEEEPLRKYNKNVPKSLEAIIVKMLRKDPDERFQHAGEALRELCKVKYKSLKSVVQELYPDMDFSDFLPDREELHEKITDISIAKSPPQIKSPGSDKRVIDKGKKIKLDFHALDVLCKGTGIRYKEAKDALIEARGDSLKAIEIIANLRKGIKMEEQEVNLDEETEEKGEKIRNFFEDLSNSFSKILDGIILIRKSNGVQFLCLSSSFIFLIIFLPVLFIYWPKPTLIIFLALIILPICLRLQIEFIDRETYEFRERVDFILKNLGIEKQSISAFTGEDGAIIDTLPVPPLPVPLDGSSSQVKSERKSRSRDKEKALSEKEKKSSDENNEGKESPAERVRDRAARRKQEREKKTEEEISSKTEEKPPESKTEEPAPDKQGKADSEEEIIQHICSRVEGITTEEARGALLEADGDQTKAVMNLKKKKRAERKAVAEPVAEQEVPVESPPEKESVPEPVPEPAPSGGSQFDQEKIDYVCRRTKVTPEEAIKALEENNGDEIEAVMSIKKSKRRQRK